MEAKVLESLLRQTWESPVFGDSFPPHTSLNTPRVAAQIRQVAGIFTDDLGRRLTGVASNPRRVLSQIAPKTVSFCPALSAGELQDIERLSAFAVAIGLMYWADQTMDRGDLAMPFAIELFAGRRPKIPGRLAQKAHAQAQALKGIFEEVDFFARPEDRKLVLACFREQVLLNEVYVQRLSQAYLKSTNKGLFLDKHASELARRVTIDAGFPSVSSSLYALYRQEERGLPPLQAVYDDPAMRNLLQVCNVVVRLIDELGDYQTDAGLHPEWGVFNLNPFNQPHPAFVGELLRLGGFDDPELAEMIGLFKDSPKKAQLGEQIVKRLLAHTKACFNALPRGHFDRYLTICKRVLEIGYINRAGDIALAGS